MQEMKDAFAADLDEDDSATPFGLCCTGREKPFWRQINHLRLRKLRVEWRLLPNRDVVPTALPASGCPPDGIRDIYLKNITQP